MSGAIQHRFDPYSSNGGSILAIAGKDFAVIAGDTRQSEGYSIQSRYQKKVFPLTSKAILAVNGFAADGNNFVKRVKQRLEWYTHAHNKEMPIKSIARLIQTMLYARRMFPYYVYNVLSGIEEDGTGAVYSFDPVGSYERETCRAAGAAQSLLQPFLDNQIYFRNHTPAPGAPAFDPSTHPLATVLSILVDSFSSATERHIEVGDSLEGYVILSPGRDSDDLIGDNVKGGLPVGLTVQELDEEDLDVVVSSASGKKGCRVFLVRKELKRD